MLFMIRLHFKIAYYIILIKMNAQLLLTMADYTAQTVPYTSQKVMVLRYYCY